MNPIKRGDYRRFRVRIKRNGEYIVMTGGYLFFTMKKNINDSYDVASLKKKVACIGTEVAIELFHEDTKNLTPRVYEYDFQFVDSLNKPITIQQGKILVEPDVTEVIT